MLDVICWMVTLLMSVLHFWSQFVKTGMHVFPLCKFLHDFKVVVNTNAARQTYKSFLPNKYAFALP